jgi:RNA polymerase sigma factor (sigma-70 family)
VTSRGQNERAHRQIDRLFNDGTFAAKSDSQLLERFAKERDDEAFAALVVRHGSMVLSVCRAVSRDSHDADDAFQATFLVLAKKADARWVGDSLGSWLYRVARRAALRVRLESTRRAARERSVAVAETAATNPERAWAEVVPLLHEEIDRLPERFRAPIVLCELETLTRDEAAQRLGWPSGTVASRLARGRHMLRTRLLRRGIAPAVVTSSLMSSSPATAALPSSLANAALSNALGAATNRGAIDPTVLEIAEGVLKSMFRSKLQRMTIVGLVFGAVLCAGIFAVATWQDDAKVVLTGVVVDGDEKPVRNAEVVASFRERGPNFGAVTSSTRSDDQGNYRISVPRLDGDPRRFWASAVWAYSPGRLVASRELGPLINSPDVPIRLVVGQPARTLLEVRGPDGKPIAGARISPRGLKRGYLSIPAGLGDHIADGVVTDAHGRATMAAFFSEELQTVFVSAPGLGTQFFGFGAPNDEFGVKVLNLSPVGRLRGRLIGPPEAIARAKLLVNSALRPQYTGASAIFEVSTDEDGRFEIAEIPSGRFRLAGYAGSDARWYVDFGKGGEIEQGMTTEIEAPLKKSVRVSGKLLEKGTNRPIENVLISPFGMNAHLLRTDSGGRFHGFSAPGTFRWALEAVPLGFSMRVDRPVESAIPADASEFTLPPIELERAGRIHGVVEDERGQPVPGAMVTASVPASERGARPTSPIEATRSDAKGAFDLLGVPPDAAVDLGARLGDLRTPKDVVARVGDKEPVRLRVDRVRSVGMAGKVVDDLGRPISGAQVHLRALIRFAGGQIQREELVDFDGDSIALTDTRGVFKTRPSLDRDGEYIAIVSADGFRARKTGITLGSDEVFAAIRLQADRPSIAGSGRVIDRQGRPVVGAEVWLSTEPHDRPPTPTGVDGRFNWDAVERGPCFLFARKAGYRFHGQIADLSTGDATVTLTRTDERPLARMTAAPPVISHAEAIALARRAIEPLVLAVMETHKITDSPRLPILLANIDPARALALLNEKANGKALFTDAARASTAAMLARRNMDDAKVVVEAITDPSRKASACQFLANAMSGTNRDGKRELLDHALQFARETKEPAERAYLLGRIAEGYLDLGDRDRATALLREAEALAAKLATTGSDGDRRAFVADSLARVDLPAALRLLGDLADDERRSRDRYMINLIQRLAGQDPAEAERLLKGIKPFTYYNRALPRIAYLIAAKDPERARRVIREYVDLAHNPFLKPYALGMSALGAAALHPEEAAKLLLESFSLLEAPSAQGATPVLGQSAASVAACLLYVVERVSPELVEELFWRALSFRNPAPRPSIAATRANADLCLAIYIARYDREAAGLIFRPVAEQVETLISPNFLIGAYAYAGAELDPKATLTRIETLPDRPGLARNGRPSPRIEARQAFAVWLAADPSLRWAIATGNVLGGVWTVEEEYVR